MHPILRIVVSTLLIVASSLKSIDYLSGREGSLLLIEMELVVGCLLLVGVRLPLLRPVLIFIFALFAIKSGSLLVQGNVNCGCLGSYIDTHPGYMLVVDLVDKNQDASARGILGEKP